MNLEIERKFLLKSIPDKNPIEKIKIKQWYYKNNGIWERVRKCESNKNGIYYLHTIKTTISKGVNLEDEKIISKKSYDEFIDMCKNGESRYISKDRLIYDHKDNLIWEVDVFKNGYHLIIAEIEIPNESYLVELPKFIKNKFLLEVTGMRQFSNKNLSNPYNKKIDNIPNI